MLLTKVMLWSHECLFEKYLSVGILKMQEGGDLYKLKMKWWKQKRGGGQCLKSKTSSATSLGYENVSGIFLVTFSGCFGALIVCIGKFL